MIRRDRQIPRFSYRGGCRIGIGEGEAGKTVGERRLADALGTADQPAMMHPAAPVGVEQRRFGRGVAEPVGAFLRRRPVADLVEADAVGGVGRHSHAARSRRRALTACQMVSAMTFSAGWASTTTQRSGSRRAISR